LRLSGYNCGICVVLAILVLLAPVAVSKVWGPSHNGGSPIVGSQAALAAKSKRLCALPPNVPSSVYPASSKQAFVENWTDGGLLVCGGGKNTTIATPPSGFSGPGYFGMGGMNISGKLDLLLISFGVKGGWICVDATTHGCSSNLTFKLPSSFCRGEPRHTCNPNGVVITNNTLGFAYVDGDNAQLVSCTRLAASCSVDAASSAFSGYEPAYIARDGSEMYVSDLSCTGNIWSGTISSMSVLKTVGDSLGGITYHKALYVADDGRCSNNSAHIIDVTTGVSLPTPFAVPGGIGGLDETLQFGAYTNLTGAGVWSTS